MHRGILHIEVSNTITCGHDRLTSLLDVGYLSFTSKLGVYNIVGNFGLVQIFHRTFRRHLLKPGMEVREEDGTLRNFLVISENF